MTADVTVRPFAEADWAEVRAIIEEVAAEGETYCLPARLTDAEAREFWLSDAATVVAEVDGEVLGSAHMGPNRPAQGAHVGTASFMVSSAARGRGVGRALGEHVVEWHRRNGFRAICFNAVVETNASAVRLWQSLGFTIIGTVPGAFRRPSGEHVGLHVMHLPLVRRDRPDGPATAAPGGG
ncbi:MAG TPA: GNAT family N-acetyltransferase [Marmoricola sp.]|nr:GNAT family N-acetyltransferase [Marmoricola sp.]